MISSHPSFCPSLFPLPTLLPAHHIITSYRRSSRYGGATIQGILPYYYTFVAPGTSHMLDACLYNSMYSNPCRDDALWPRVKSVHFTNCQKPWKCNVRASSSLSLSLSLVRM